MGVYMNVGSYDCMLIKRILGAPYGGIACLLVSVPLRRLVIVLIQEIGECRNIKVRLFQESYEILRPDYACMTSIFFALCAYQVLVSSLSY